jgi:hypothetical protein
METWTERRNETKEIKGNDVGKRVDVSIKSALV